MFVLLKCNSNYLSYECLIQTDTEIDQAGSSAYTMKRPIVVKIQKVAEF